MGQQSREAAQGIEDILKRVQVGILESVRTSEEASQIAEEQNAAVFSTLDAFDTVISAMDETGRIIVKINQIIKKIDECKSEAIASIMNVNAISEETAAASEQVTAVAEEQKAGAEQVKGLAETLHKMAGDLVSVVNIFQTRTEREEIPVAISVRIKKSAGQQRPFIQSGRIYNSLNYNSMNSVLT